jgi:predicted NUDIX family NTP pyrophosphohydrolase
MAKLSAGILLYRRHGGVPEVFLVHPGGPFFAKKDLGSWSIPKGEIDGDEDPLVAAIREFKEETGSAVDGAFMALSPVRQKSGKVVHAWALEGDIDADAIISNTFSLAWPPRSGKQQTFPEIDRGAWFDLEEAKRRVNEAQSALIAELATLL